MKLLIAAWLTLLTAPAAATSIRYQAADLPDIAPDEDLWHYEYFVTGHSFASGQGFDIYFEVEQGFQFGDLVDPQLGASEDWSVLAIQADPALLADGFLDAVALVDGSAPAGSFSSSFVWRGSGAPGAQRFEIFDEQLRVLESGMTIQVPEPGSSLLVLGGLALLGTARVPRRRALALTVATLACVAPTCAPPNPLGLRIDPGQIVQVSAERVGIDEFLYTFRVVVENPTYQNALGVNVAVNSTAASTIVVDAGLSVGDVPAQISRNSSDTFSIRQDRSVAFDPAALQFSFYYQVEPRVDASVPYVTGLDEADAYAAIEAENLVVGNVSQEFSTTVPAGDVISQSPEADTAVDPQSAVDLVVSWGPEFTLELPKPYVDIPRGATLRVPVRVHRNVDAGWGGYVSVETEPGRTDFASGAALLIQANTDLAWIPVSSDPTTPIGGPVDVMIVGTGFTTTQQIPLHVRVLPEQPSSQALIAQALAEGRIDYGTSLLYRAYTRLVDESPLPAEFRGTGPEFEDPTLDVEISDAERAGVAPELVAQLQAFLLRPDDPASAWGWPARDAGTSGARAARAVASAAFDPPAATLDAAIQNLYNECLAFSFPHQITERHPIYPVRVHTLCTGTAALDALALQGAEVALRTLDTAWIPMVSLMTAPLPDGTDGGDDALDIYLLVPSLDLTRGLQTIANPGSSTLADTARHFSLGGLGDPRSYVRVSSGMLSDPATLSLVLLHEVFHVLQLVHIPEVLGARIHLVDVRSIGGAWQEHWFTEASAEWGAQHFARVLPLGVGPAQTVFHRGRFRDFQNRTTTLTQPYGHGGGLDAYQAYIWPLFIEKETGSTRFMQDIWFGYPGLTSFEDIDNHILAVSTSGSSLESLWKEFAFRNLNNGFVPGDPLPRPSRYVDLDSYFPDGMLPGGLVISVTSDSSGTSRIRFPNSLSPLVLPPLTSAYVHLVVEGPLNREVSIDWSDFAEQPGMAIQAVVQKSLGDWKYKDYTGKRFAKLCIPATSASPVLDAWFVLSNANRSTPALGAVIPEEKRGPKTFGCDCDLTTGDYCFSPLPSAGQHSNGQLVSRGIKLNAKGTVAGYGVLQDFGSPHPVIWKNAAPTFRTEEGIAYDVSSSDDLVGYAAVGPGGAGGTNAYLWRSGVPYNLGALFGYTGNTIASAVTDHLTVVGTVTLGSGSGHALIWKDCETEAGGIICETLTSPGSNEAGVDVNKKDQVLIAVGALPAVDARVMNLKPAPGEPSEISLPLGLGSLPTAINDRGEVLVMDQINGTPPASSQARVIGLNGQTRMLSCPVAPCFAMGLNNLGQAVGTYGWGAPPPAGYGTVLWTNRGTLVRLPDGAGPLPGGTYRYSALEPWDINDLGDITGTAWTTSTGNPTGFLLTPLGE